MPPFDFSPPGTRTLLRHHSEAMDRWRAEMRPEANAMDNAVRAELRALVAQEVAQLRQEIDAMTPKTTYLRAFITPQGNALLRFDMTPATLHIGQEVEVRWHDGNAPRAYVGKVQHLSARFAARTTAAPGQPVPTADVHELVILDNAVADPASDPFAAG